MITRLQKLVTGISLIQEIPEMFFASVEVSVTFGDHLFPAWTSGVFGTTSLNRKFEAVYKKYKAIRSKAKRDLIVEAFTQNNQIENLCSNTHGTRIIELPDLPKGIRKEIDALFLHLYNSSINYHRFETHITDSLRDAIDRFIAANGLEVCPFCGLEGFLNIEGQSRIALDHWLCKDLFPMSAVNFDNLFPIGSKCNERPAKGSKNILIDGPTTKNRVRAYYPYLAHAGITTEFNFINEPTIAGISDADWDFSLTPSSAGEQDIFESWNSTLNISIRYLDYHRKNIFPMWEADYKRFIEDTDDLEHAKTIDELRRNFRRWKASFPIKGRSGALLYRSFIDYLIKNASNAYMFGLCENFRR